MDILKKIFITFLLLFPLGVLARFQFSNGVAISLNDVLLPILFFVWIINKFKSGDLKNNYFLSTGIVLFIFVAFISLFLNLFNLGIDKYLISLTYLVRFICYALLYFIVKDFSKEFKNTIKYFLFFVGIVFLLFGYLQYFFFPSLKSLYQFGWDEHLYRLTSTFLDPNFAGSFLVIYFIFTLDYLRNNLAKLSNFKKIGLSTISLFSLFAIYLTYSRSALIMLFISLSVYLILLKKKKILFFVFSLLIILIFLSPRAFQTEGTNLLRVFSSEERIKSMQIAVTLISDNPVFGVGFNAYRYAQHKHGLDGIYWQVSHAGAGTDASLLFVLATTGVVGLVVYCYFIIRLLVLGKVRISSGGIMFLSVIIGLLANSLFINSLFYVFILEWIFILAGLIESN